ncbi:MAG: sulfatase [Mailhella sp.]|nr:sulfatase [Mailhella sp.]
MNNAIVVMFDTLQFNYVGCYGNDWIKTPNMDRFAREGVLFENAYTEGLPTIPCRRAMHTGRFTLPYGGWKPLSMEDTTIADLCWGRPIDTALIFDCPMYRQPKFGYTRGFDKVFFTHGHEMDHYYYEQDPLIHYSYPYEQFFDPTSLDNITKVMNDRVRAAAIEEMEGYLKQMQYWKSEDDRYVARTMKKAVEYLKQVDRNKQFYLWVDSFDPHEPWNGPSCYVPGVKNPYDPDYEGVKEFFPHPCEVKDVYTEDQLHHIRMLYAEMVTVCDRWFGYLLDSIRELGFEENTLVMMVSDHGSPMGNGMHGHGAMRKLRPWPYEELSHIPFIVRFPGCEAGKRVSAFVMSIDVAPTVCDWLGIGVHPSMHGKSLLPVMRGETDKVHPFAISGYFKAGWAIYTEDWSYVHWPLNDKNSNEFGQDVTKNVAMFSTHLTADGKGIKTASGENSDAQMAHDGNGPAEEDTLTRHHKAATTDGEAMWTCTPGSAYITPEADELYDRRNDPFQLNNVIKDNPEVAKKLLMTLKDFIADLQAENA